MSRDKIVVETEHPIKYVWKAFLVTICCYLFFYKDVSGWIWLLLLFMG